MAVRRKRPKSIRRKVLEITKTRLAKVEEEEEGKEEEAVVAKKVTAEVMGEEKGEKREQREVVMVVVNVDTVEVVALVEEDRRKGVVEVGVVVDVVAAATRRIRARGIAGKSIE